MNGVSKKLFITVVAIQAVVGLSDGADDKWPYALVIGGIFFIYKITQGFLDWKHDRAIAES